MIKILITSSSDIDLLGEFYTFKNQINIGHTKGDIQIKHPKIRNSIFQLKVTDAQENILLGTMLNSNTTFNLNGRSHNNTVALKKNDFIRIEFLEFEIVEFHYTDVLINAQKIEQKFSKLKEQNHPVVDIINIIDSELEMGNS